jgi:hypothetical protein
LDPKGWKKIESYLARSSHFWSPANVRIKFLLMARGPVTCKEGQWYIDLLKVSVDSAEDLTSVNAEKLADLRSGVIQHNGISCGAEGVRDRGTDGLRFLLLA